MDSQSRQTMLLVRTGDEQVAIDSRQVVEIVLLSELSRPPHAPQVLAGLMNLGGCVVPITRLRRSLGFESRADDLYTPVVIMRRGSGMIGLVIDEALRLLTVVASDRVALPADSSFNRCADHGIRVGHRIVAVIDRDRLLLEAEQLCIDEFSRIEADRLAQIEASAA